MKIRNQRLEIAGDSCTLDNLLYVNVAESYFQLVAQSILKILEDQVPGTSLNVTIPKMVNFLNFLKGNACLSIEECIIAIALLQRFIQKQSMKGVQILKANNIGTFLVVLFIATMKIHRDIVYKNSCFARIFVIPIRILNESETLFLQTIDFEIWIQQETFSRLFDEILHILSARIDH
ncbi:MAG: hypothetical protein EZS28_017286 [Streblomastix strix]|uniref:Cyclin N-terminal domain-containing protein n=1 Tax=Streblomastix strix TaxID=222440 RepID=A0A5J4VYA9_9EUKA|nr:MAG: hypothetical protein EZS28_017286 [Streblomastix strix]